MSVPLEEGIPDMRAHDPDVREHGHLDLGLTHRDFDINPFEDKHPKFGLEASRESTKQHREQQRRKKKRKDVKEMRRKAPIKTSVRETHTGLFSGFGKSRKPNKMFTRESKKKGFFSDIGTGTGLLLAGALGLMVASFMKK
jgi:hypothetical protein